MPNGGLSLLIGQRVSLPGHFDVPVVLEDARPLGNEGAGGYECRVRLPDGSLDEAIISVTEAQALVEASATPQTVTTQPVDAERLRLLVESARIRLAYAYDRQFAVSLSGIRTLPHQIEAVYQRMLPQPRLRFLLADDPGAGKTIMAGLLVKELKLREAIERVLILCPAPLTIQWQDEMLRWFGEPFDIIFAAVDQQQLVNPWQRASQVIASLDYAKQDDIRERVWQQRWDLVIIDEAHKCSAYARSQAGRSDEAVETKRYQLAKRLTADADHVLLLTATPHHGDEDRFAHFLRILDPDLFPEPHRVGSQAATIRKNIFRLGKDVPLYGELVAVREEGRTGILPVGGSPVFEVVPSDSLLDLPPYPTPPASIETVNPQPAADFLKSTYQLECRSRCQQEQEHFAKVCCDYLVESFKARIYRAQDRVMILRGREREAPEIALARQRAEQDLADLERTRKERFAGLDRLSVARTGPVRHLATVVVLTSDRAIEAQLGAFARETDAELRRKKEIRAEDLTIESLVAEGFPSTSIERVGSQKIGFDIRAHRVIDDQTGQIEVRRIEVKGYTKGTPRANALKVQER